MTRILTDLSFFIMISIIKTIITINNNNNNHKLFKSNNVRYQKFVDLYKSSAKTQTSLLSRINLVNKTQTLTTMMITKIRLNLTIMDFNGDPLLLKHINIMSEIKKTSYQEMSKSNMMFTKTLFTRMPFIKKRNFIITIVSTIIIVSTKNLNLRIRTP